MLNSNTMIYILLLILMNSINSSIQQAFYDATSCRKDGNAPGTRYTCTNTTLTKMSCQTFLIFRANHQFPTISTIATLFGLPPETLLELNHIDSSSEVLVMDREVVVPISCSCSNNFFQAKVNYTIKENTTLSDDACGVFEGLVKRVTLLEENQNQEVYEVGFVVNVPLKCACPNNGYEYLVTYPLVSKDSVRPISTKFGISIDDILAVNNMNSDTTVYPESTILIPLHSIPRITFDAPIFQPPTPGFLATTPTEGNVKSTKLKKVYIVVSVIGSGLVVGILIVTCLYINALNKCKHDLFIIPSTRRSSFNSFSTPPISSPKSPVTRSSPSSCLSPDLLAGIKYSLYNFKIEEIRKATSDFSEDCKVSENSYRGSFDDVQVLIKGIDFSEIRHVIDLHSKINHVNIMKLIGVCYNESSWSYLVLEHPLNGSLRACLTSTSSLTWHRRTQIAFDVAMGLHYLHYCIANPYMQTGLCSEHIFVTSTWRAKLAVLSGNTNLGIAGSSGLEYANIFEFGMILIEILSGKADTDKNLLRDSIGFLGGEGSSEGGCFEHLRGFMDPCLKEDYPLAEALCLGVLAKACVECDPLHRPSVEDILKVLARMV